jgi:uncharacterized OB-fold protein
MNIVNAIWTPQGNILIIKCACGKTFTHPADKTVVICPHCKKQGNMKVVKNA